MPRAKRLRRQLSQVDASAAASPVREVDLEMSVTPSDGIGLDHCDFSSPLLLKSGTLLQDDATFGKDLGALTALLWFSNNHSDNEVNTTYSLFDGFLRWDTADAGSASFYRCGENLFASFGAPPTARTVLP